MIANIDEGRLKICVGKLKMCVGNQILDVTCPGATSISEILISLVTHIHKNTNMQVFVYISIYIYIYIRDKRISEIQLARGQVTSKIYWPTHIFNLPTHIFNLPSSILANIPTFLIV